jgi:hypothetical protein
LANSAPPAHTAAPLTPVPPGGHTVYTSIVKHDEDLVGLIAYSLYKQDKLAFREKQRADIGRDATPEELMAFARGVCLPGQVAAYRQRATIILQQMYDDLLGVQTEEIEGKYKAQYIEELKKKHPFWESVWEHVVASILLIAFGGLIALIYAGQHAGWPQMVSNVFNLPAAEARVDSASAPKH